MKTEWGLIVITRDGKTLLPEYEICSSREQAEERARQERSFGMTVIVAFRQVAEWEPVEAAAPETEGPVQTLLDAGAVPFADETGHGFEIDLPPAQPAAEGAREDDGLAAAEHYRDMQDKPFAEVTGPLADRLLRAVFEKQTPEDIRAEAEQMCEEDPPCEVCMQIANYSVGAHSDWLAEDRRRARAEGGAGALEAAADGVDLDMGKGYTGGDDAWATNVARQWLRDRAAGLRETGGKG